MGSTALEVRFGLDVGDVPDAHRTAAEGKAREAFVLTLLRQGDLSAGRAAELLGIDRWELSDRMSDYGISPFGVGDEPDALAHEVERASAASGEKH